MGTLFTRAVTTDGKVVKIQIPCTLEQARWMIDREIFHSGTWETLTNKIYL